MKKLFLHIGAHKTGTTSIQKSFSVYSNELESNGFFYLQGNPASKFRDDKKHHEEMLSGYGAVIDKEYIRDKLSEINFKNKNIISSEYFSWLFNIDEIIKLKEVLFEFFDEVSIISYIRRQDSQLVSHRQQGSKNLAIYNGIYYSGGSLSIPTRLDNYDGYLDYNTRLGNWIKVFGSDSLTVKVFDKKQLKDGDVVVDFFDLFNIRVLPIEPTNESNGFERTKIGHLMNQTNIQDPIRDLILLGADNSGKQLPSKKVAFDLYQRYRQSNIELNKKLKLSSEYEDIFDDDFSKYPDHAQEEWSEDSANQAFLNIFNALSNLLLDVDTLKNSAIALESTDLKKAYKLMLMAHKAKPNGPYIKKKLDKYKKALAKQKKEANESQ